VTHANPYPQAACDFDNFLRDRNDKAFRMKEQRMGTGQIKRSHRQQFAAAVTAMFVACEPRQAENGVAPPA
jgi:hypothetical protein